MRACTCVCVCMGTRMHAHLLPHRPQTTLAAQLIRDPEVGVAFERLLWVSVSAEPDLLQLLRVLYSQLTGGKLSEAVNEERDAVQEVSKAAKGVKALVCLECIAGLIDPWTSDMLISCPS